MAYLRKKEFSKAKEYFAASIRYGPDFYASYFGLGCALEEEQIDSAIKAFEKSIRLKPNFIDAHYRLGRLYAKKSDPRAREEFKATIQLAPRFAEAHNDLAVFYASMEPPQLELAREYAQKAISLGYKINEKFLTIIGLSQNRKGNNRRGAS
jgi:tetratricopeptide (TPR) repeat protein